MMKRIYVELEDKLPDGQLKHMVEELEAAGIGVCMQIPEGKEVLEELLILTDRQDIVDLAWRKHIACVGYEPPGTKQMLSRVRTVVQGLEGVNAGFLEKVYQRHWGIPWMLAETKRLVIRESVPEDFDRFYEIYQEPGMTAYMPGLTKCREKERKAFLAYIHEMYSFYEYGLWTVVEKFSGRVIGRAGLENGTYRGEPVLEIGYMLSGKYQKRGYGLEAVKAVTDYGFLVLGAKTIYAFIDEKNRDSLRLIRRAGFWKAESEGERICVFCCDRKESPCISYRNQLK